MHGCILFNDQPGRINNLFHCYSKSASHFFGAANLLAGVSALHHINQEPQITLIRATLDLSRIKRALSCLFPKFTN